MTKTRYFAIAAIVALIATSCTSDTVQEQIEMIKEVELLEGNTLKFKDQATFDRYVSEGIEAPAGFYSIYQNFNDAMNEAEAYYEREGGYEEFKQKYSGLYFPEFEDDYSAYLPVSDESKARFLNLNGEVYIGGELKNFKDVDTYEKLDELGLAMPEYLSVSTRAEVLGEIKYNDRKLWINATSKRTGNMYYYQNSPVVPYQIHLEVCFRKKGFLGLWYNYSSHTELHMPGLLFFQGFNVYTSKYDDMDGPSSHDYYVNVNASHIGQNIGVGTWTFGVIFQGFGGVAGDQLFTFKVTI
ncbi:MAG: DUF4848 domain-containing protein [Tannerella sp.]|jgi:hypothetical protein|nr:DUF4848 domain-containing protein [Tannerella sp.]